MGYYSTKIGQKGQPLLAFVLPWGKYTFQRMPFGISTAPGEFQSRMSNVFVDLPEFKCYLDDLAAMTAGTLTDHIHKLRPVLERIRAAGLQINAVKSNFAVQETEYLGYIISRERIRPHPSKFQAIYDIAKPKNKRELRRFMGLINYYRDIWPRRSHTFAPLTAMTSKIAKFLWTPAHQTALDDAKHALSSVLTLHYPDYNLPF